jgi:hypothetical protein
MAADGSILETIVPGPSAQLLVVARQTWSFLPSWFAFPCPPVHMVVQANWQLVMDAASLTTAVCSGTCALTFFFAIRTTTGMIILPMFVGFVIESFNSTLPIVTADYILTRDHKYEELTGPGPGNAITQRSPTSGALVHAVQPVDPRDFAAAMATPLGRSVRNTLDMFEGSEELLYPFLRDASGATPSHALRSLREGDAESEVGEDTESEAGEEDPEGEAGGVRVDRGALLQAQARQVLQQPLLPHHHHHHHHHHPHRHHQGSQLQPATRRGGASGAPQVSVVTPLLSSSSQLPTPESSYSSYSSAAGVGSVRMHQDVFRVKSKLRALDVHISTFGDGGSVDTQRHVDSAKVATLERELERVRRELDARQGEVLALKTLLRRRQGSSGSIDRS